jgi:aminoglycoside phosphotransferase family enzyme/predicted kinase
VRDAEHMDTAELLAALSDPATYGRADSVERHETHASWVFLAGPWAYKVKKPVKLAFLDYSTLARRHDACAQEVQVNRELAGDIYLGVRAIVREGHRFRLAEADAEQAVEYVVQMRRFQESQTLQGHIDSGSLAAGDLRAIARRLASFHDAAEVVRSGTLARVGERWRGNLHELAELVDAERWRLVPARRFGEAFIAAHAGEIEDRERNGRVRDGHGDLRCEHVLLGREVRIVDRIEFDPELRKIDVGCDLAFLAMDLESQGHGAEARRLLVEYGAAGGRAGSAELLSFYAAGWALVRAKVAWIAAHSDAQEPSTQRAEELRALAERLCWRARGPIAVIVAGPAASGKSTLAQALSRRSGLSSISSDGVRKQLAGIAASERARPEHYSSEFTRATYAAVGQAAHARLARGEGVIVDATCRSSGQRATLLSALVAPAARVLFVSCQVSLQTALARAQLRMSDPRRVSDATPQIVAAQHREFQAPEELAEESVLALDCEQPLEDQLGDLTAALDRQLCARCAA